MTGTMSEAAILRKELHKSYAENDSLRDTIHCARGAIDMLKLDVSNGLAKDESKTKKIDELQKTVERQTRMLCIFRNLLEDNDITFDENLLVEQALASEKELRESLDRLQKSYRRVSNENTPPSMGSDAQICLAKYRKQNAPNYQHPKNYSIHNSVHNMLKDAFSPKNDCINTKGKKKGKKSAKNTLEDMPGAHECNHTTNTCPTCGIPVDAQTVTKDEIDIPQIQIAKKVRHYISRGTCKHGHRIDTTPKGLTKGSVFGPNLMTSIVFMFFFTLSLNNIKEMLRLHGIESVSKTTIMTALIAVAGQKFAIHAAHIRHKLKDSMLLMADETPIKIGRKKGYAWVFIGEYGISISIKRSRAALVVDMCCPHFYIPIVVDGYSGYNKFNVKQRCWAHILRQAELLAATRGGDLAELHQRLQAIFHGAKKLPPDITDEKLDGWIDSVVQIGDTYTKLDYKFGGKLKNAAPNLFTFVKHPGMPPTNNMSERTLRRIVLHRKVRLMFQSVQGMWAYGCLMTCMMTWDAQGHDLIKNIHQYIMAD